MTDWVYTIGCFFIAGVCVGIIAHAVRKVFES